MKALVISLLFAVVAAKFDDKRICDAGGFACYNTKEIPKGFPKDVAEVDAKCSMTVEQSDCMSDLVDLCGNIFPMFPEGYFGRLKTKVHKVCDKDSALYQALVKDVACMKSAYDNSKDYCSKLGDDTEENAKKEKGFNLYEWNKFQCMSYIVEKSCNIAKIRESCGEKAENTLLEIAKDFKTEDGICMDESYQQAVDLLKSITLEPSLKSQILKHLKRIS
uniref:Uncharacterized protein n=1 Tax=Latrodectus hesperus TaxID=256737 RepID=E7D1R8_LATHE|nr:hypothetical protein [Latrodectus hesperus]